MLKRPVYLLSFGVVLLLGVVLWWIAQPKAGRGDVPVIIYLVDTLRADHLGVYGHPGSLAPNLDALAAESVLFEQAYAPAPWTPPSVASLLTSKYVCEHGVHGGKDGWWLNPAHKTLAERLTGAGYLTGSYYTNVWVGPLMGLDRGFEISSNRHPDNRRSDDVTGFLQQAREGPFLLYLHTSETHSTFLTPAKYIQEFEPVPDAVTNSFRELWLVYTWARSVVAWEGLPWAGTDNTGSVRDAMERIARLSDAIDLLYDAAVRWADDNLGAVVAVLKAEGVWDEAIFIFISDHGEEFSEHDAWFHGQSVYEELVRAPLMIHFPGGEFAGRRVREPVSLVDLMPTILEYVGRPELCEGCRGTSFLGLLGGDSDADSEAITVQSMRLNRADYYRPWKESRGDVNVVVRRGAFKGIVNEELNTVELYDLKEDPQELSDKNAEYPELVKEMAATASDWLRDCEAEYQFIEKPEIAVDEKTLEILRSNGYLN